MKKTFKWLAGSLATVAVLVGCSSAGGGNPQEAFTQRYEQLMTSTEKATMTIEASIPELEMNEDATGQSATISSVMAMVKDVKLSGTLTQNLANKELALNAKVENFNLMELPELKFVAKDENVFMNIDVFLAILKQQGNRVAGLEQFAGKSINVKDLAEQSGNTQTVNQFKNMFAQTDSEAAKESVKKIVDALKSVPADRFSQNGDKLTAKLNIDDVVAVVKATGGNGQQLTDAQVKSFKEAFQEVTFEYVIDAKKRDTDFKITAVTAGNAPFKRAVFSLKIVEQAYQEISVPGEGDIVTPEQLREAISGGGTRPTPSPEEPREVTDEEFEAGIAGLREYFATGEGSTFEQAKRQEYYNMYVERNTRVKFSDSQKEELRKIIFGE